MRQVENRPLPNLSFSRKLLFSASIIAGIVGFLASWRIVAFAVYGGSNSGVMQYLGVALGALAASELNSYFRLLLVHAGSMFLFLLAARRLFLLSSLRRRRKLAILITAFSCVVLDLGAWIYAPSCSSTNTIVGYLGAISAVPLLLIAMVPLWQMWGYRRWEPADGLKKRVLIIGGGFAGLTVAQKLHHALGYHPKLEILLLDKNNYFLFPPLLPSASAGTIESSQVTYPFRRIFETTNVGFRKVDVHEVDPINRTVSGGIEVEDDGGVKIQTVHFNYDYLALAPGSVTQHFNTEGVEAHAFFMREVQDALALRNQVINCFERAVALDEAESAAELLSFVIVGAGPTGIETATELYDLIHKVLLKRYPEISPDVPRVVLVQSGAEILPGWHPDLVRVSARQLARMNIEVLLGCRVTSVGPKEVRFGSARPPLGARTVVWCAGVKPSPLLGRTQLPLDKSGRIIVAKDLSVSGFPEIFAIGDSAFLLDEKTAKPLPPLGQVAFQQGSSAAGNILRCLEGKPTVPFHYFDFGGLLSVGEHFAAVNLLGLRISGFLGWLIWRTLYLGKLPGFSTKVRVVLDWTLDLLIERSVAQLGTTRLQSQSLAAERAAAAEERG